MKRHSVGIFENVREMGCGAMLTQQVHEDKSQLGVKHQAEESKLVPKNEPYCVRQIGHYTIANDIIVQVKGTNSNHPISHVLVETRIKWVDGVSRHVR